MILGLVAFVVAMVILLTPECSVESQALLFDIDRYYESMDPEICEIILERIESHNIQCEGEIEILDCG